MSDALLGAKLPCYIERALKLLANNDKVCIHGLIDKHGNWPTCATAGSFIAECVLQQLECDIRGEPWDTSYIQYVPGCGPEQVQQ